MGHYISYACLVYISYSCQYKLLKMRYVNHIDFFSIYDNVCAQKSLKRTWPGFDRVMPLHLVKDSYGTFFKIR